MMPVKIVFKDFYSSVTKAVILGLSLFLFTDKASAQEDFRFDAGISAVMTGYLGDANGSFPFKSPSGGTSFFLRYIANNRWGFKTDLLVASVRGDAAHIDNQLPEAAKIKFSSTVFRIAEMAELNFFNYGEGRYYRHLRKFSPYVTAGLGIAAWKSGGSLKAAPSIPFGIGAKYKPSRRINLSLQFIMEKIFSDKVDAPALSDPLGIKTSPIKCNDWISAISVGISYEFSERCATCNYKN